MEKEKVKNKRKIKYYSSILVLLIIFAVIIKLVSRYKVVIVVTNSMEPTIMVNSLSILDKCRIEDIKVGDIVMYKSRIGFNVTHRVIRIKQDDSGIKLYTKGDNNLARDRYPVTKENFLGKIIYTNNNFAKYFTANKKIAIFDYGTLVIVFCFLALVAGIELVLICSGIKYLKINKRKDRTHE